MSIFKLLVSMAQKIISLQRIFFWGENELSSMKLTTILWHDIEAPTDLGGLGVSLMVVKNLGFLLKWWWRLCEPHDSLWKRVLKSIQIVNNPPNNPIQTSVKYNIDAKVILRTNKIAK